MGIKSSKVQSNNNNVKDGDDTTTTTDATGQVDNVDSALHRLPINIQQIIVQYVWIYRGEYPSRWLIPMSLVCRRWFKFIGSMVDQTYTLYDDACPNDHHLTKYVKHLSNPRCLWNHVRKVICIVHSDKQLARLRRHLTSKSTQTILHSVQNMRIETSMDLFEKVIDTISLAQWSSDIVIRIDLLDVIDIMPIDLGVLATVCAQLPHTIEVIGSHSLSTPHNSIQFPANLSLVDLHVDLRADISSFIDTCASTLLSNIKIFNITFHDIEIDLMPLLRLDTLVSVSLCTPSDLAVPPNVMNYLQQMPESITRLYLAVWTVDDALKGIIEHLKCTTLCLSFRRVTCQPDIQLPQCIQNFSFSNGSMTPNPDCNPDVRWLRLHDNGRNLRSLSLSGVIGHLIGLDDILADSGCTLTKLKISLHSTNIGFTPQFFERLTGCATLQHFILDSSADIDVQMVNQFIQRLGSDYQVAPLLTYIEINLYDLRKGSFPKQLTRYRTLEYQCGYGKGIKLFMNYPTLPSSSYSYTTPVSQHQIVI
ncbi:hypothetical protein SAMD00019534_024250, partial [Acytostelium subglobosum LB1]|uniref:hypothetical protein n=1 Tax=Acytostelium subglobosum LB1 TaxID=1410327 RepID=UPI000644CD94